eukprot:PITA_14512
MNQTLEDIVKEELQKLLDAGFIYPISDSEWVSPLVLVPKKNGKWRICVDYWELNKATKKDHFPLPFIDQVLDGLAGKKFFSFLDGFSSKLASPLFDLLGKDVEFIWNETCQEALNTLKNKLVTTSILRRPNWALPFHIHIDASNKAIGVALGKIDEKLPYAIYFISKNLSKAELNYTVIEKELLAIVHSLNKFRHYITGYQTFVHTDHAAIRKLLDFNIVPTTPILKEKRKIVRKSTPFTWIGGNLFKLGPDHILRRCVREEEVFDILLTCHDGPCGGHFAAKRIAFKILQAGYYWPTLHQDVKRYISQCDWCQRMGKPTPKDEMPMQPQVTFEPFEKWGVDFVSPIRPPSKQRQYIIVCTDYLTKWAETKAIKATIEEYIAEFLRENIFYKFGYPKELVIDQGSKFTSNFIEELLTHHKIKHRTSTPYHPQANG